MTPTIPTPERLRELEELWARSLKGNTNVTTKTTTTDPLAGLPIATAKPPRVKKQLVVPAAPATGGNVVNLGQAKAALKRKRLTGQEYKDARDFARKTTGYNDTSPIWGQRMGPVLVGIESNLNLALTELQGNGFTSLAEAALETALLHNQELQKRIATGQLIGAQQS